MRKHFGDLAIGQRFRKNGRICEKIEPVFTNHTPPRLKANYRDIKTGKLIRQRGIAMVEVIDTDDPRL